MISIGEKTGELERMLTVVANTYDDQVEATLDGADLAARAGDDPHDRRHGVPGGPGAC